MSDHHQIPGLRGVHAFQVGGAPFDQAGHCLALVAARRFPVPLKDGDDFRDLIPVLTGMAEDQARMARD